MTTSRVIHRAVLGVALAASIGVPASSALAATAAPSTHVVVAQPAAAKPTPKANAKGTTAADDVIVDVTTSNIQSLKDMSNNHPMIFLVTAPSWCGACQQLDPVIRKVAQDDGTWMLAIADQDKDGGASREFNVTALPTMIAYVHGKEATTQRFVGAADEATVKAWIEQVKQEFGPMPNPGPTTTPAPVPTTTDPVPVPTTTAPDPYPTTDPGPVPTTTDPVPVPTTTDPGPVPTTTDPVPVPTTTDPGPVPTTIAPNPYPTTSPAPVPTTEPGPAPTPGPCPTPGPGPQPGPHPGPCPAPPAPGDWDAFWKWLWQWWGGGHLPGGHKYLPPSMPRVH